MMDDVRDRRGFCDKTKVIIQEQHFILTSAVKEVLSVTIAFYGIKHVTCYITDKYLNVHN